MKYKKLYVIQRLDLDPVYCSVQAGHAVAAFVLKYPTLWKNGTLIYLGVSNEDELKYWKEKIYIKDIQHYAEFREPDINDQITAIAVLTDKNVFSKLKLIV